jgi:hypothetical protein
MKQSVKELQGDAILAKDGSLGEVLDVYFDDERWAVRYLVADTGAWLAGRRVLLSPASIDAQAYRSDAVTVNLTREQVKNAPGVDTQRPVSRQQEVALASHYGYRPSWGGPLLWGAAAYPGMAAVGAGIAPPLAENSSSARRVAEEPLAQGDTHLRSSAEVIGYAIEARDGEIGEVDDLEIEEDTWAIGEVIVDTR